MATDAAGTAERDDEEVEWQFDAIDLRPVERWLAALPAQPPDSAADPTTTATAMAKPAVRQVDRYLDTDDWRISRAGFVLRTRRRGRKEEVTLKDTRPADAGGLRRRLEVTEPLPRGGIEALGAEGPVGRRVSAVAGRRALREVLEVRTRRRPYALRVEGEDVAEVALDETVIAVGTDERPARLRRVEVEVRSTWADPLVPLVETLRASCGLQPATLSKFEAGLMALGVPVPGTPDLGDTAVTTETSLADLAYAVLRRQLAAMLAHDPGTRLGEDIEELHDMRVATRRLRAAMELFVDVLPARVAGLRSELGWLADVLGAVRDLDVQLERMETMEHWTEGWEAFGDGEQSPLEHLKSLLLGQHDTARSALLDAMDSERFERLAAAMTNLVRQGPPRRPGVGRTPAAAIVGELVAVRHRRALKAARRAHRSGVAADYHRLRIRCKRLRYSLEFTAGVYPGQTERFVRRLAALQDTLGLMQDAEVASTRLATLAADPSTALPPATVFTMGCVAQRYRSEADTLLDQLKDRVKVLDGKDWHRLSGEMQRRRIEALSASSLALGRAGTSPGVAGYESEPAASLDPARAAVFGSVAPGPSTVDDTVDDVPTAPASPTATTETQDGPAVTGETLEPGVEPSALEDAPEPAWPTPAHVVGSSTNGDGPSAVDEEAPPAG
jgi:CHAD domain-containing protein